MGKKKIFNDPVYGFISFPDEILYDILDHPYFQRLRRISQMGLSHYVYPGALHTRFHHAMGALHLMTTAILTLQEKGIVITDDEKRAVCIAILLHDIGHGPFSHALENLIIPYNHESLSLAYMEALNEEYGGQLDLAISIFKDEYPKKFLHELISGQLDVDRMDYLNRDSFYTGVAEGIIGYDRIIKMLHVVDNHLVVEQKGIYSIEKFLMSRRLMYLQVYLHKTSLAAEQMLILYVKKLKEEIKATETLDSPLHELLIAESHNLGPKLLQKYAEIDDIDIMMDLKKAHKYENFTLQYIAKSILKRQIFNVHLSNRKISPILVSEAIDQVQLKLDIDKASAESLVITGDESNQEYNLKGKEIKIFMKNGDVKPFSSVSSYKFSDIATKIYFLCSPRV